MFEINQIKSNCRNQMKWNQIVEKLLLFKVNMLLFTTYWLSGYNCCQNLSGEWLWWYCQLFQILRYFKKIKDSAKTSMKKYIAQNPGLSTLLSTCLSTTKGIVFMNQIESILWVNTLNIFSSNARDKNIKKISISMSKKNWAKRFKGTHVFSKK